MNESDFKIERTDPRRDGHGEMTTFYSNVFGVKFETIDLGSAKLYAGKWINLDLLFCPAEIAGNHAKQNRHQFDIGVKELDNVIRLVKENYGETMGDVTTQNGIQSIGIYDPDRNSIVLKSHL